MSNSLLMATCLLMGQMPTPAAGQAELRLVKTIELPGKPGRLDHFGFDAETNRLFVSNQGNASLDVIDVKEGKVVKQVSDQKRIHGIAIDPKSGRIFVGNGDPGECAVTDGQTYEVVKRLPAPKANQVQFDPHSGRIFVGHLDLTAIDPAGLTIEKVLTTPGDLRAFRIDPTAPRLYANSVTDEVCVFDTRELKLVGTFKLKAGIGNAAMALDPDRRRLFVGCRGEDRILVLHLDSGKEIASLEIPPSIDDMWYDSTASRIYASTGGGEIVVIAQKDADHYVRANGPQVEKQARTCYFDSQSEQLFLGVSGESSSGTPARIQVYEASKN
jgi:DNA-binding beta-propeller fold protein YncE